MSYDIIYGDKALDPLRDVVTPEVLECFEANMENLRGDPIQYSKPSRFPFPTGQQFSFTCPGAPGQRIGFRVHFKYGADERSLHVFDVKVTPYHVF